MAKQHLEQDVLFAVAHLLLVWSSDLAARESWRLHFEDWLLLLIDCNPFLYCFVASGKDCVGRSATGFAPFYFLALLNFVVFYSLTSKDIHYSQYFLLPFP